MEIILIIFGGFILYLIIVNAVRTGVSEALSLFKEDILKEINKNKPEASNKTENLKEEKDAQIIE